MTAQAPLPSAVHSRKVDIQSPTDLLYLRSHLSRAALQKLDLHFPPTAAPDGEDILRSRVAELVDEVRLFFALGFPFLLAGWLAGWLQSCSS